MRGRTRGHAAALLLGKALADGAAEGKEVDHYGGVPRRELQRRGRRRRVRLAAVPWLPLHVQPQRRQLRVQLLLYAQRRQLRVQVLRQASCRAAALAALALFGRQQRGERGVYGGRRVHERDGHGQAVHAARGRGGRARPRRAPAAAARGGRRRRWRTHEAAGKDGARRRGGGAPRAAAAHDVEVRALHGQRCGGACGRADDGVDDAAGRGRLERGARAVLIATGGRVDGDAQPARSCVSL